MRKIIKASITVAAVVIATAGIKMAHNEFNRTNESNLLLENIEALSADSDFGEDDNIECIGSKIFAIVETTKGETDLRIHFSDSVDIVYSVNYIRCYASGQGNRMGSNNDGYITKTGNVSYVKCIPESHRSTIYD